VSQFTRPCTCLLYTVILCVVNMLPFMIGMSGLIYLGRGAGAQPAGFLWQAIGAQARGRRDDLPIACSRFLDQLSDVAAVRGAAGGSLPAPPPSP